MPCIFCLVATEKANAVRVYEDDDIVIFRDHRPAGRIHLLAIPRQHIESVVDLTATDVLMLEAMKEQALAAVAKLMPDVDPATIQMGFHKRPFVLVGHLHMHILHQPFSKLRALLYSDRFPWYVSVDRKIAKLRAKLGGVGSNDDGDREIAPAEASVAAPAQE
ncbi:HIT-like domain-containing protein [Blastocladiella britannica]|nr:HIT-like domain-containing protein [Blastocladiella britannica]